MKPTRPIRVSLFALAAALLPALALAADAPQAVLAAHDARIAATIKGDVAALGAMMTDDLSYTHSSGVTETKAEFLEGLKSGKYLYRAIDAPKRRVRVHGDSALVSGPAPHRDRARRQAHRDRALLHRGLREGGRARGAWPSGSRRGSPRRRPPACCLSAGPAAAPSAPAAPRP